MNYTRPISVASPGLILILLDQSGSMALQYGREQRTKAAIAAMVVNKVIYDIMLASQEGSQIKDRCYIGAIGYGQTQQVLTGGLISQVADRLIGSDPDTETPMWIAPVARGSTPMARAFEMAHEIGSQWSSVNTESFPPIVINITDGEPDDITEAQAAAQRLMQLGTADGRLLIFNAHISGEASSREICLPTPGDQLPDRFADFLFSVSSPLPDTMVAAAKNEGFASQPGARGLVFNASAETLLRLVSFGSFWMRSLFGYTGTES